MTNRITVEVQIDAAHRIPCHPGKCRFIHGHRYRIVATFTANDLIPDHAMEPDSGMVMDFSVLKGLLRRVIEEPFDHHLILWEKDDLLRNGYLDHLLHTVGGTLIPSVFGADADNGLVVVPCIPTAENLARHWYDLLFASFHTDGQRVRLESVTVWETPASSAEYRP